MNKTFKDLGLIFELNSACITCLDNSCHNNLISKIDNQEYHVHISTNNSFSEFLISATLLCSSDISEERFYNEFDTTNYLCENFNDFRCF